LHIIIIIIIIILLFSLFGLRTLKKGWIGRIAQRKQPRELKVSSKIIYSIYRT